MRTRTITLSLASLVAAVALVAGACSDDSTDTAAEGGSDDVATSVAPANDSNEDSMSNPDSMDEGAYEEEKDIVDTAIAAGDFTTLVSAVQAAGLEETLRGEGPFTVFAPTDAAFEALPPGTVEALLADPTGDLASILTYHVVPGKVMAADVVGLDGQQVTTVNGATFTVNVDGDAVSLTDGAGNTVNVTTTDIETSNGVIHVIDAVLLPA